MRFAKPFVVVSVLLMAPLTGCYGSTGFVSELGNTSATLNGTGTTDDGPADVYFEYWRTSTPAARSSTPARRIPGGVTGPFSAPVTGLTRDTSYSYRLCGADEGEPPACANTRTFVTGRSSVRATGSAIDAGTGFANIDLTAIAAPAGETPAGRAFFQSVGGPSTGFALGSRSEPNVTCVDIDVNTAVVGFLQKPPFPDSAPFPFNQQYAFLYDGGLGGEDDRFDANLYFRPTVPPADCPPFPNPSALNPLTNGAVEILDLRSAPTG